MKLTPLLTDHAVVQRDQPVPVWGWTESSNTRIRAELGPVSAEGISGEDGHFLLRLPPLPAGGPHKLIVESLDSSDRLEVNDILSGEVWLASGQSNMEWPMESSNAAEEIESAGPGQVRMINVERRAEFSPNPVVKARWQLAGPETIRGFSAVGNFFGQRLQDELNVPVGIIHSSWGGTFIQTWISRERLVQNSVTRAWTHEYEAFANSPAAWQAYEASEFRPADAGNLGVEKGWHRAELDDSSWQAMPLPNWWQDLGHDYSAVVWFRLKVRLPSTMKGRRLVLHTGAVDKTDITYAGGVEVGRTGSGYDESVWNKPRVYAVPSELTQADDLAIAVRVYSFVNHGGMIGPADQMYLSVEGAEDGERISLAGEWRYAVEQNFGKIIPPPVMMGHGQHNSPYMCFNNMIKPMLPVGVAGFIWYQGESNADNAGQYAEMLRALIQDWRYQFGLGDVPFGVVQLANYMKKNSFQPHSSWALLREAQADALELPNVGLAVIIDAGDADDIHPKDKKTVGRRLAQWALGSVYGKACLAGSPLYRGARIEGSSMRVSFDNAGDGLSLRDGAEVRTLVIAGRNGEFHPAKSRIEGASLLVWHDEVDVPAAVRYAWADNPEEANLVNSAGLPAGPFRTDR